MRRTTANPTRRVRGAAADVARRHGTGARDLVDYLGQKAPAKSSEAVACTVAWLAGGLHETTVSSAAVRAAYPRRGQAGVAPAVASTADALRSAARTGLLALAGRDAHGTRAAHYRLTPLGRLVVDALPDRRRARSLRDGTGDHEGNHDAPPGAADDGGRGPTPRPR